MVWLSIVAGLLLACTLALVLFTGYSASRVEAALPPDGRFMELTHARVHLVEQGQGPTVLLIHGIAGNLRHFTYGVAGQLAAHYRVIAVDRPGCGYSVWRPGAPATLQAQADAMAELLTALQVDRAVVAGHSLGGAIALSLAQRHPERVTALALVAPLTKLPEEISPAFKALAIPYRWVRVAVAWTLASPLTLARRDETMELVFGPETTPRDFPTRGGGLMALRPSNFVAASTDLNVIPASMQDIEAGYAAMRVPVHVLYGKGDRILSHRANGIELVSRISGTQLTLVDGGHMLPITQAVVTADFIAAVAKQNQA